MSGRSVNEVRFEGALRLREAADVRAALLDALNSGDPVDVDLTAATDVDLSVVQVLIAARNTAQAQGVALNLQHSGPDSALGRLLIMTGFFTSDGESLVPDGQFWLETEAA